MSMMEPPSYDVCEDVPLLVRRTVRYLSVVLALKDTMRNTEDTLNTHGVGCGTSCSGGKAAQVTTRGDRPRSNACVQKTVEG